MIKRKITVVNIYTIAELENKKNRSREANDKKRTFNTDAGNRTVSVVERHVRVEVALDRCSGNGNSGGGGNAKGSGGGGGGG